MRYTQFHALCAERSQPLGAIFERLIQTWYTEYLPEDATVIDGGAYRGRHTVPIARVASSGVVHAFEPVPSSRVRLSAGLEDAGIGNVVIDPRALSDFRGPTTFQHVVNAAGYSGLRSRPYPDSIASDLEVEMLEVTCTTIDDYCSEAGIDRLPFIKLDLEGGEFGALRGAGTTAATLRPIIAFENGLASPAQIYGYEPDEFFAWFPAHDMVLTDAFGHLVEPEIWTETPRPFYFWAIPTEVADRTIDGLAEIRRDVLSAFDLADVTSR